MSDNPEVIIVGGGVIGCSIAYHLAQEGVRVAVLDRGDIGGEASRAAAGMLAPLAEADGSGPFLDLGVASLRLYPSVASELKEVTAIDVEYLPSGILRVAMTDAEEQRLKALADGAADSIELHWLPPDDLRSLEPAVSTDARGALYSPAEHQVNADRLMQAYAKAASIRGAKLIPGVPVTGALTKNGRVEGVKTQNGNLIAGHVVLAAGAWSGVVARSLGLTLPVFPVRGQMMALPASRSVLRHILWGTDGYLVPKANRLVFAGATVERVGYRTRVTSEGLRKLKAMSKCMAPRFCAVEPVDAWAGLRPGSADGLPILGPMPGCEGLTVATGHFRNGILLAPITGRLIARSILNGAADESVAPFSPARFA